MGVVCCQGTKKFDGVVESSVAGTVSVGAPVADDPSGITTLAPYNFGSAYGPDEDPVPERFVAPLFAAGMPGDGSRTLTGVCTQTQRE